MGIFVSDLHKSSVIRSLDVFTGQSLVSGVVGRERGGMPFPHCCREGPVLAGLD